MNSTDDDNENEDRGDSPSIWDSYIQDIKPLKAKKYTKKSLPTNVEPHSKKIDKPIQSPEFKDFKIAQDIEWAGNLAKTPSFSKNESSFQIDKSTASKLRRGQMPIDARIDLHGMYQHEARNALLSFIGNAYQRQHRCILVVTGKGKLIVDDRIDPASAPGVIKRNFKSWLAHEPYASMILKIQKAQIKDGGEGAYYILLRKKR